MLRGAQSYKSRGRNSCRCSLDGRQGCCSARLIKRAMDEQQPSRCGFTTTGAVFLIFLVAQIHRTAINIARRARTVVHQSSCCLWSKLQLFVSRRPRQLAPQTAPRKLEPSRSDFSPSPSLCLCVFWCLPEEIFLTGGFLCAQRGVIYLDFLDCGQNKCDFASGFLSLKYIYIYMVLNLICGFFLIVAPSLRAM